MAYNPLSARVTQNPYPIYNKLRARDPVHHSRLMDAWLFTRYEDVDTILRNHRQFSNDPHKRKPSIRQRNTFPPPEDLPMLFLDPPDHTRLRSLVNKAFTRQAVNALQPRVRGLMAALLDDIEDPAGFDLMKAAANPLPVTVIAEMLGVPPEDRARYVKCSCIANRRFLKSDRDPPYCHHAGVIRKSINHFSFVRSPSRYASMLCTKLSIRPIGTT